jgi:hypothetical protein
VKQLRSYLTGAVLVYGSLPDGEACGIKRIAAQVHLVAVVVTIAVGIWGGGIRPDGGFVGIRQTIIVAIDA